MKNTDKKNLRNIQNQNVDQHVVEDFGKEWQTFNHSDLTIDQISKAFNQYFDIFPFEKINKYSAGFDMGCGSGRWAKLLAPNVACLTCIDPSPLALEQAKANLKEFKNVVFECSSVSDSQIEDGSQDFGYSLGVLHHVPNTLEGIKSCAKKLKSGAPFLVYLYYKFDNRPPWFKAIWVPTDFLRRMICILPYSIKFPITQLLAYVVYWPLSRLSLLIELFGGNIENIPLSDYRQKPLYFLRTDALDRFGTRLEKRFTKSEIEQMLVSAGFCKIRFSDRAPYWVAVAIKS